MANNSMYFYGLSDLFKVRYWRRSCNSGNIYYRNQIGTVETVSIIDRQDIKDYSKNNSLFFC